MKYQPNNIFIPSSIIFIIFDGLFDVVFIDDLFRIWKISSFYTKNSNNIYFVILVILTTFYYDFDFDFDYGFYIYLLRLFINYSIYFFLYYGFWIYENINYADFLLI